MLYTLLYKILAAIQSAISKILGLDARFQEISEKQDDLAGLFVKLSHEQTILLLKILAAVEPLPAVGFKFTFDLEGQITEGTREITMKDTQKVTATIAPVDKPGNPAPVQDGSVAWTTDATDKVKLTPSTDGLSCEIAALGPLGVGIVIKVSADADLGEGVSTIEDSFSIDITSSQAVGLGVKLSDPVEQTA